MDGIYNFTCVCPSHKVGALCQGQYDNNVAWDSNFSVVFSFDDGNFFSKVSATSCKNHQSAGLSSSGTYNLKISNQQFQVSILFLIIILNISLSLFGNAKQ